MNIKLYSLILTFLITIGLFISTDEVNAQYCNPESSNSVGDKFYISMIAFAGQKTDETKPDNFYNDYSGQYDFSVASGELHELYVINGEYTDQNEVGVWIDWNQDGVFSDKEFMLLDNWGDGTFYNNIEIPSDAKSGTTTMRIRLMYNFWGAMFDPCGDYYEKYIEAYGEPIYGEVNDYTINVQGESTPASIVTQPVGAVDLCSSLRSLRLSVGTDGTVTNYQWQKQDIYGQWYDIKRANSSEYYVDLVNGLDLIHTIPATYSNNFRVVVHSFDGDVIISDEVTVSAFQPVTTTIINQTPFTPCENSDVTINANLTGSYDNIRWEKEENGGWTTLQLTDYPTANTANLVMNNVNKSQAGNYRVVVDSPATCGGGTVSATIGVFVAGPFTLVSGPDKEVEACADYNPVSLKVETEGSVLSYQWQKDGADLVNNLTANSSELLIKKASIDDIGSYVCKIVYVDCDGIKSVETTPSHLNVYKLFSIQSNPKESYVCEHQDTYVSVVAVGNVYGYQWQKDGKNISLADNPYANSSTLYINNASHLESGVYRCVIDAEDCPNGRNTFTSGEALVYVKRGTQIIDANKEVKAPLAGVATLSINAHVTAIPPQMVVSVQWYRGNIALENNNRIAGAKSSILSINKLTEEDFGGDYWVVVEGLCSADTARGFVIKKVAEPIITVEPITNTAACENTSAIIAANVTVNPANTPLIYSWLENGVPLSNSTKYSGVNTTTLTINDLSQAEVSAEYSLLVTDASNANNFASSNPSKVILKGLTQINSMSDRNITIEEGKELQLFVDATVGQNNVATYQWYKIDEQGIEQEVSGQTQNQLVLDDIALDEAGEYVLKITTECDNFTFPFSVVVTSKMLTVNESEIYLTVTPNPISDFLNINLSGVEYNTITITNSIGENIYSQSNSGNKVTVDLNTLNLPSGVYFIQTTGTKNYYGKFILNR